jgi:hypothetical protein
MRSHKGSIETTHIPPCHFTIPLKIWSLKEVASHYSFLYKVRIHEYIFTRNDIWIPWTKKQPNWKTPELSPRGICNKYHGKNYTLDLIDSCNRQAILIKKKKKFSYIRKFRRDRCKVIYEEMRKYLVIYEEAVNHIWLCTRSLLNFLIYGENFLFIFISLPTQM